MKHTDLDYIFHYTDDTAALSIIREREFWISKHGSMNDSSEGNYCPLIAHQYLIKEHERYASKRKYDEAQLLLDICKNILQSLNHDSYILSFSKNGDSLSQWRAYTPEGRFSIGFPIDRVHSFCKDNGFPDLV